MAAPKTIQLDPRDNVQVALTDLPAGETVVISSNPFVVSSSIPAKHKFALQDFPAGAEIVMYGVTVGKAREPIAKGGLLTTSNVVHDAAGFQEKTGNYAWTAPDVTRWTARTFNGYHRQDGQTLHDALATIADAL